MACKSISERSFLDFEDAEPRGLQVQLPDPSVGVTDLACVCLSSSRILVLVVVVPFEFTPQKAGTV